MPIASPIGYLDVVNATLRASQVEAVSRLSVANTATTQSFSVGDKFHVNKDSVDPVSITGNVVASGVKIGNLSISPAFDFASVSNVGNVTANVIQFANATTGFTTTANVEIGGNIGLTANAQVKVGSNVLAEYTGPHGREPKEVPLKKYPEIAFEEGKFDYNADRTVFTQAGYIVSQSESYDSSTSYPAAYLFDNNLVSHGSAWVSKYGTFGTGTGTVGEMTATNFSSFNPGSGAINGPWLKIQLPVAVKLSHINIHRWSGSATYALPGDVTLYGSNNGTTYSQIGSTFTSLYTTLLTTDNMNLNVTTTDYYKYYVLHFTSTYQSSASYSLYVAIQELKFYGYEEPAPPGDLSLDTTIKSTFNSVRSNNYVMYFDGDGFDPNDTNSNNLVTGSSVSVVHHNATYDSTGKYWTLDGSTGSNVTTGDLGFEGDVPHTVSMWVNASNVEDKQLFTIGSGYDKSFLKVDDTQIAANTWHNVTYAYQGEGGSKVTYVDGRKVVDDRAEDTFGEYPPFPLVDYEMNGYKVDVSSTWNNNSTTYEGYNAFDFKGITGVNDTNFWVSAGNDGKDTYDSNGNATSSDQFNPGGGASIVNGSWIKLQFPHTLKLDNIELTCRRPSQTNPPPRHPKSGIIWGSNDGNIWTQLNTFNSLYASPTSTTDPYTYRILVNANESYKYFNFQITATQTQLPSGATHSDFNAVTIIGLKYYGHKEGDLTRFPEPTRVLKYPHITLDISTGVGYRERPASKRGYVVTADTYGATGREPVLAFDGDTSTAWYGGFFTDSGGAEGSSPNQFFVADGGNASLTDASSTVHYGSWLTLELPHKLRVSSIKIRSTGNSNDARRRFRGGKLFGSDTHNPSSVNGNANRPISGNYYQLGSRFDFADSSTNEATFTINATTAYKCITLLGDSCWYDGTNDEKHFYIHDYQIYGTQEDTGTPVIVGGPFAGKVANFRVYDTYLGEERIQEIYDAQKDAFGHKKSSMTFYKGRIGVGTTEPEGALTVMDEPRPMEKFPKYGISGHDVYVEDQGRFVLNTVDGNGELAFDELTTTSWDSVPPFDTRLSPDVDEGSWLKIETPERTCLKKIEIESSNKWKRIGVELRGDHGMNASGATETQQHSFGEGVGINKNGTRIAVAAPHARPIDPGSSADNNTGYVKVFEWTSNVMVKSSEYDHDGIYEREHHFSAWRQLGNTITGSGDGNNPLDYLGSGGVALSDSGKTLIIGSPLADPNGTESGQVRVFDLNGTTWTQRGSTIEGATASLELGFGHVCISGDGNIIAFGERNFGSAQGRVRVLEWNPATTGTGYLLGSVVNLPSWVDRDSSSNGVVVTGSANDKQAIVDISSDAKYVATGGTYNTGNNTGKVIVFEWDGSNYVQRGSTLNGENAGDRFGQPSFAISDDGNTLAVGAWGYDATTTGNDGALYLYHWDSTANGGNGDYVLKNKFLGHTSYAGLGGGVKISGDGTRVVTLSPYWPDSGGATGAFQRGLVEMFEYDGTTWYRRTDKSPSPSYVRDYGVEGEPGHGGTDSGGSSGWYSNQMLDISTDGSAVIFGQRRADRGGIQAGRADVFQVTSTFKGVWGSNDNENWTKITDVSKTFRVTDHVEYKLFDNSNFYKHYVFIGDNYTRIKNINLYGVQKMRTSTFHDGELTLTKSLNVPRIGPTSIVDKTPKRGQLIAEYNTETNPIVNGVVKDTSGKEHHLGVYNRASYSASEKAFAFSGAGDYLNTNLYNTFKYSSIHSVSIWVKRHTGGAAIQIFCHLGNGYGYNADASLSGVLKDVNLYWSSNFGLRLSFTHLDLRASNTTLPINEWVHLVYTYDGTPWQNADGDDHYPNPTNIHLYKNGVEQFFTTTYVIGSNPSGSLDLSTAYLSLGGKYPADVVAGEYTDASISNYKLYNTVLTPEEVKTLYKMGQRGEGNHVVNFDRTRVGIGLGSGEAPRAALDVRGDIYASGRISNGGSGGNNTFDIDGYRIHAFTSSGSFLALGNLRVDILLVGGGGGGGEDNGGGGGAGGLVFVPKYNIKAGETKLVTIGAGGNGSIAQEFDAANQGGDTIFGNLEDIDVLRAIGGGRGLNGDDGTGTVNQSGGSGGGGDGELQLRYGYGLQPSAYGLSGFPYGFGNRGGYQTSTYGGGGGGGGAGAVGGDTSNDGGGIGGDGLYQVTINGRTYNFADMFGTNYGEIISGEAWFAGGGAGGNQNSNNSTRYGGKGGGGDNNSGYPTNATANTGGGGAGQTWNYDDAGGKAGGSGIILLRYPI